MTTAAAIETADVIGFAQIVEGEATCEHCGNPATVTLWTGADPEPEPHCWVAARQMIEAALSLGDQLWK